MSRKLHLPVPTQVITGSLASGKTTFINHLITNHKPSDQVWAILVNELGVVGIDQAILSTTSGSTQGLHIKELAGGCLCCVLPHITAASLVQLIRTAKPDRLIIEPSGLAHPSILLNNVLSSPHLATALDIQPTICLIDLTQQRYLLHDTDNSDNNDDNNDDMMKSQIDIAEILIGTKADLCDEEKRKKFIDWSKEKYPKKKVFLHGVYRDDTATADDVMLREAIAMTRGLVLQRNDNSSDDNNNNKKIHDDDNKATTTSSTTTRNKVWLTNAVDLWTTDSIFDNQYTTYTNDTANNTALPQPGGHPIRKHAMQNNNNNTNNTTKNNTNNTTTTNNNNNTATCGWIFHHNDIFDAQKTKECITSLAKESPYIMRIKAILRIHSTTSNTSNTSNNSNDDDNGDNGDDDAFLYVNVKGRMLTNTVPDIHIEEIHTNSDESTEQCSRLEIIISIPHNNDTTTTNSNINSNNEATALLLLSDAIKLQDWNVVEKYLIELIHHKP